MAAVSVIVPVFRSQATVEELHERLCQVLERHSERFEIIFVEDCGGDASWRVLKDLARRDPRVRAIELSRNFGQHNALLCGIRAARHEIIVTIDDDLQNPPEEIPVLLAKLSEGYDVVYGAPDREQHGLLRNLASRITKAALQRTMNAETARHVSAFRVFRTPLRESFRTYGSPFVSIDVLLTWGTSRFTHVTVRHAPRQTGSSNYTVRALVVHAVNMMTGFSTLPLELASLLGFACTLLGVAVLIYVVAVYLARGGSVPGFPFLASIVAIFSGAQLFALGIIGEYPGPRPSSNDGKAVVFRAGAGS